MRKAYINFDTAQRIASDDFSHEKEVRDRIHDLLIFADDRDWMLEDNVHRIYEVEVIGADGDSVEILACDIEQGKKIEARANYPRLEKLRKLPPGWEDILTEMYDFAGPGENYYLRQEMAPDVRDSSDDEEGDEEADDDDVEMLN